MTEHHNSFEQLEFVVISGIWYCIRAKTFIVCSTSMLAPCVAGDEINNGYRHVSQTVIESFEPKQFDLI